MKPGAADPNYNEYESEFSLKDPQIDTELARCAQNQLRCLSRCLPFCTRLKKKKKRKKTVREQSHDKGTAQQLVVSF